MAGRAIVHVGLPRTGTTAFQHVLDRNRAELARRGVLYPDLTPTSAPWAHINHQHLGETLDGRRPVSERRELLDKLSRQVRESGPDVVLLSYEGLSVLPPHHRAPAELSALFLSLGYRMEVLLTVRPQGEWINSQYGWRAQFIMEGRPFAAFFDREIGSRRLRFGAVLKPWERATDGRVHAVPLRDATSREPLPERILGTLGLTEVGAAILREADRAEVSNVSPGPLAVEVSRRLRALGIRSRLGHAGARRVLQGVEEAVRAAGHDRSSFAGLDERMGAVARDRFAADNALFARSVWGSDWEARVAEPSRRPVNELAATGIDAATEGMIRGLVADACAAECLPERSPLRRRLDGAARGALAGLDFVRRRIRSAWTG